MAERILIVRLGAMGDVIHALPAVAMLRRSHPDAEIGWVIEERWVELISTRNAVAGRRGPQKPLVDFVHTVNTRGWRKALTSDDTWNEIRMAVRSVRAPRYTAAVDFQGAMKSAIIPLITRAPMRAGFRSPRERPASLLYTRQVIGTGTHVIDQNLSIVQSLWPNHESDFPGFKLPIDPVAEGWCDEVLTNRGIRHFAVLNPGAGWGAKQWPATRYAEVAKSLGAQGVAAFVNHGPAEEVLAREVGELSCGAAQPIACSIGELISLMRRAKLFVGGDTGPMHLAAACGVPVVALFGPTDPARNGPYGTEAIVLRSDLSRTSYSHTANADRGLAAISAAQVIDAARQLLGRARG